MPRQERGRYSHPADEHIFVVPIGPSVADKSEHHAHSGKYLTFTLDRETYGLKVLCVREIIQVADITPVPQMPLHFKGVINLRGKIIPVIDLRLKFCLPTAAISERTCIVVVQIRLASGSEIQLGLLVDDVQEVLQIAGGDIEQTPEFGTKVNTDYILGIAKLKGKVAILLDIDRALTADSTDSVPMAI